MTQPNIEAAPTAASDLAATPELLTIAETCDALRISKWSLYRLIQERKLATIKIGARRLVPRDDLRNLVSQLRAEGDDDGR